MINILRYYFLLQINIENIDFPIRVKDITRLEEQNKNLFFKVNVFVEIDGKIYPHRLYKIGEDESVQMTIVNVLLTQGRTVNNDLFHFTLIEDTSKFFSKVLY